MNRIERRGRDTAHSLDFDAAKRNAKPDSYPANVASQRKSRASQEDARLIVFAAEAELAAAGIVANGAGADGAARNRGAEGAVAH